MLWLHGFHFEDEACAITRVLRMMREGQVTCRTGEAMSIQADTVCLHGDQPQALAFAQRLRAALAEAGIQTLGLS